MLHLIAIALFTVPAALFAQGLWRGPLALIAQAGEEAEAQRGGLAQIDGSEVQQMAFDGE